MQVTKSAIVPVRASRIAADFLMLAGASVAAGLLTAAAASAVVILLSSMA